MHIAGLYFILAIAGIFIVAAALRGSKNSLYFLIPAGVIFLILSAGLYSDGIHIKDGSEVTVYNETETANDVIRTENKTASYTTLFHENPKLGGWFNFMIAMIGVMLILFGTAWRFL